MPDKDPFEIARRLDEFGAGKGPRPAKSPEPAKDSSPRIVKKKARPTALIVLLILGMAAAGWVVFQRFPGAAKSFFPRSPHQTTKPSTVPLKADPPKMIPSFDGKGEIPAFTVQVPGTNTPPPKSAHGGN